MLAAALLYAWIQYGWDGAPHARVIPAGRACPRIVVDGRSMPTALLAAPSPAFGPPLCDRALPSSARDVRAGGARLPRLPRTLRRIAVFGDTGCRIKEPVVQNCNDPAAWPFARVARAVARDRPDLIVHVGDYQYRENGCWRFDPRCRGTPFGDNWPAWNVDFFAPAAPLFGAAPIVFARGNHEDCKRAGVGWSRYLAPLPSPACRKQEATAVATFGNLRIVNVDSAATLKRRAAAEAFEHAEHVAGDGAHGRETWLLTHRPPVDYLRAHEADDPNGAGVAAIIAGHIHLFAALPFGAAPPTILAGTGGDTLSPLTELGSMRGSTVEPRFGYLLFERTPDGWTISERDPDGSEHRRCVLRRRTVHC